MAYFRLIPAVYRTFLVPTVITRFKKYYLQLVPWYAALVQSQWGEIFGQCIGVIKSRRLRWSGHVARMEEGRSAFKILTGKPTRKGKNAG